MTLFRFRYSIAGDHTHIKVYAGDPSLGSLGHCGNLSMRNEEWTAFMELLDPYYGKEHVQFVLE